MKSTAFTLSIAALMMSTVALAQPGPNAGRCGPGGTASGIAADCPGGRGMGPGGRGMGPGARWGRDFTPGWGMMSPAEQQTHRDTLRSFKDYDECKAYMDKHREQMAARAKERGRTMPAQPRRDACAGLKAGQK